MARLKGKRNCEKRIAIWKTHNCPRSYKTHKQLLQATCYLMDRSL